jgi:NAD(P)-dependent dehydrogenase (short-subunit alcohol dehydrogenase family)
MTTDFERQTALVIGVGSGMGRAAASILAARGAHVIIADHDEAAVAREAEAMADQGLSVVSRVLDARSPSDRAAPFIETEHGLRVGRLGRAGARDHHRRVDQRP